MTRWCLKKPIEKKAFNDFGLLPTAHTVQHDINRGISLCASLTEQREPTAMEE
jgi:hypothetical protein